MGDVLSKKAEQNKELWVTTVNEQELFLGMKDIKNGVNVIKKQRIPIIRNNMEVTTYMAISLEVPALS